MHTQMERNAVKTWRNKKRTNHRINPEKMGRFIERINTPV